MALVTRWRFKCSGSRGNCPVNREPKDDKRLIYLTADARIMFSDKQPAKFADLKAGQSVTFRFWLVTATKSMPATLIYASDFVIIKKAKGEKKEKP